MANPSGEGRHFTEMISDNDVRELPDKILGKRFKQIE